MLLALIAPARNRSVESAGQAVASAEFVPVAVAGLAVASLPVVPSADNMDSAVRNTSADMLPENNYCMP